MQAALSPQFDTLEQERETRTFGMWVFLMTELMLFGGLFTMYTVYRSQYPAAFADASHHLDVVLGGINTGVLLVSSLTMALAVRAAKIGESRIKQALLLALTAGLGTLFMGIKGLEYYQHYLNHEVPGLNFEYAGVYAAPAQLFFILYFAMTGLHAIHLTIGIAIVAWMLVRSLLGQFSPAYYSPVELTGLYWHFVDIIWIFLLPLLYLIPKH